MSRRQLTLVEQHAPDVASARIFAEEVPFEPDPTVDEAEAREELLRYYKEKFGKLDLRGFIWSETEDVAWSIEELYQEVKGSLEEPRGRPSRERNVIEYLGPQRTVVILGHPGAGKTFFLRWLALHMSREAVVCGIERPIPLITSLSAFADAKGYAGLVEYLIDTLVEAHQGAAYLVERAVEEGRAVFLLDGLDEVGSEAARSAIAEAIVALRARAGRCLIIVTSRIAGYDRALPTAEVVMLHPFDKEAIRAFLITWCELYALDRAGGTSRARDEGRAEGEQLAKDVLAHLQLRTLAGNPLLLTVLAIVHRAGVRLPDHRIELYEHATKVLVERWNRVRGLAAIRSAPPIKAADAVRLLGPIALEMVRSDIHGVIHEEDLRRMLHKALSGGELVPAWWFERSPIGFSLFLRVTGEVNRVLVRRGQAGSALRRAILRCYANELASQTIIDDGYTRAPNLSDFLGLLNLTPES